MIISGAIISATTTTSDTINPNEPATRLTNSCTVSSGSRARSSDMIGTKACENAPSPNKRRIKLGILNAATNASKRTTSPEYHR